MQRKRTPLSECKKMSRPHPRPDIPANKPIEIELWKLHQNRASHINIDDKCIIELAADIQRNGLRFPLQIVRIGEDLYVPSDGSHRLLAVTRLGWKTVPCFIVR